METCFAGYDSNMAFHAILTSDRQAPRTARRAVCDFLTFHGLARLTDDAALLTSELVTNAVQHARSPRGEIHLRGFIREQVVRLEVVDDDSDAAPAPRKADVRDENGRGMELIAKLAVDWGWASQDHQKTVWLELAV
ncbi:MAG: ATP-binding protein [Candidatus Nanopelagicales bacterium]